MGDNEPQIWSTDHLRRLARAIRVAQSVKAVTADAPFARPRLRHRIRSGGLRQRCVESGVEYCHLRNLWQDLLHRFNTIQAGWVVERSQLAQFFDRPLDLSRDPHGGSEPLPAMDNAMSHRSELFKRGQGGRWPSLQIVEDSSRGISVFLQFQLLANFRLVCSAENEPCWFPYPIDPTIGQ